MHPNTIEKREWQSNWNKPLKYGENIPLSFEMLLPWKYKKYLIRETDKETEIIDANMQTDEQSERESVSETDSERDRQETG